MVVADDIAEVFDTSIEGVLDPQAEHLSGELKYLAAQLRLVDGEWKVLAEDAY